MVNHIFVSFGICLFSVSSSLAVVMVDSATSSWTPITYSSVFDKSEDNQSSANPELDLIGDSAGGYDGFYVKFDGGDSASATDGELGFRIRLSGDSGTSGFSEYLRIGLDTNADGALDFFVSVESGTAITIRDVTSNRGESKKVDSTTFDAVGTADWTTAVSASNYDWSTTGGDLDGGDPDYFLSFSVDFSAVVAAAGAGFDETSEISFAAVTSDTPAGLDDDIGGYDNVGAATPKNLSWGDGSLSSAIAPTSAIPEPSASAFILGAIGVFLVLKRRKRLR